MKRRFPLHIHISTLFVILVLLVGGAIGGLGYKNSQEMIENSAEDLIMRISRETLSEFTRIVGPAEMAARLLSQGVITRAQTLPERLQFLAPMREALKSSPTINSLYVGYGNGDFFMVRRMANDAERKTLNAPAGTAFVVQSIERKEMLANGTFIFFDAAMNLLRSDDHPEYAAAYDPRTRNWYTAAMTVRGQIKTPPYLFHSNKKIGSTIANRAGQTDVVVGVDITLETLSESLGRQKLTPGSYALLVNGLGQALTFDNFSKAVKFPDGLDGKPVLATLGELDVPVLAQLASRLKDFNATTANRMILKVNGADWHVSVRPVNLEGVSHLMMVTAVPDDELMAAAHRLMRHALIATVLIILLAIPVTWVLARNISRPMRQLAGEADAIRHFDFSQPIRIESLVLEVNELVETMSGMKRTIRRFLDISTAIAAEKSFDRLLPRLLAEMISAAEASGGVLYLTEDDRLIPTIGLKSDGTELSLSPLKVSVTTAGPLLCAALNDGKPRSARLEPADIEALGLAGVLQASGASHAIAVPLLNRDKNLLGALLLLRHEESDVARLSFIEATSGSAAVSLENKELIKAQKMLFEAFIQLIASAIDAKSPYTGGHCARVPELTKMLARAACAEKSGPYKDFQLSEEDWEAVHVAAWLHDCGKVTTPEYVVDKATKLETLYDRIHEVRMRFEVLKRDAEIVCLNTIVAGTPESVARETLAQTLAQIDADFAFIASCNEGGEFMGEDKLALLRDIANRTWTRTLNDRIGISHEELERKMRTPPSPLPATEPLLADKPEHIFERLGRDRMPDDNPWGIRMPVPALLYNKGELYNLAVGRGTLSEEERYKINEHIVQTLIMLSQLPFPKHLRQVPEIAAGHHEKMDGSGYPRRLSKDEMSPVARMMAIADIFEALTAVDRPYKKGKTLSEAIKIMSFMKKDQHIDPDLFELFLRSGVYREYAEAYMKPEQIDAVDIAQYLGS
jgi:HD-GYP domain-containing protein (c-di-GMP phosphodiesterase class II)